MLCLTLGLNDPLFVGPNHWVVIDVGENTAKIKNFSTGKTVTLKTYQRLRVDEPSIYFQNLGKREGKNAFKIGIEAPRSVLIVRKKPKENGARSDRPT